MKWPALRQIEMVAAIALTAAVVFLLVIRLLHAGPLWRDECGALQMARLPHISEIFANFPHEAFPPLFPLLVRAYTNLFGASDVALRIFGFVVGLGFLCAAWFNARLVRDRVPLLLIALIGFNTTFLVWGTTLRGYGLGSTLIALLFGLAARIISAPTLRSTIALFVVAILSVQFLLNNTVLVISIMSAAIAVCLIEKRVKLALTFMTAALLAGLSLLPYVPTYRAASSWNIVLRYHGHFDWVLGKLNFAFGVPHPFMTWLWIVLFVAAIVIALIASRGEALAENKLLKFGFLGALISIAAYFLFLRQLGYVTQPWYDLPLLFVVAASVDLIIAKTARIGWVRWARLVFVVAMLVGMPIADWPVVQLRQSNVDLVVKKLEREASAADLIVVNPWTNGVSFNWYYHGPARWLTIPVISDHRFHRYDLMKARMMSTDPLGAVFGPIESTLQSGHRVWLVGGADAVAEGDTPLGLPPAPDPTYGWEADRWSTSWSQQLASFMYQHSSNAQIVMDKQSNVNEAENIPIWMAQGWRD